MKTRRTVQRRQGWKRVLQAPNSHAMTAIASHEMRHTNSRTGNTIKGSGPTKKIRLYAYLLKRKINDMGQSPDGQVQWLT